MNINKKVKLNDSNSKNKNNLDIVNSNINNINSTDSSNNTNSINYIYSKDYNNENIIIKLNKLFFSVWRNGYIRKNIFYYLKLYNLHSSIRYFNDYIGPVEVNDNSISSQIDNNNKNNNNQMDNTDNSSSSSIVDSSDFEIGPLYDFIKIFNQHQYKYYLKSIRIYIGNSDHHQVFEFLRNLPPNIDSIELIDDYKGILVEPFEEGFIPPTVRNLILNCSYSQKFNIGVIPSTLKTLVLPFDFDHPLSYKVGSEMISIFPKYGLKLLEFGSLFNQPIGVSVLPVTLETIYFGDSYNQPFPPGSINIPSITKLGCRGRYNQKIYPGVYSPNLKSFFFDGSFKYSLQQGILPDSITKISVFDEATSGDFSGKFDGGLALPNIKVLHLYGGSGSNSCNISMTNSNIGGGDHLDTNDTRLLQVQKNKKDFKFPDTVEELAIGELFSLPLPRFLKKLYLGRVELPNHNFYTINIDNISEEDQSSVIITDNKKYLIKPGMLPESLESLYISKSFILQDQDSLPKNLKKIHINHFEHLKLLPASITSIKFDNDFNEPFTQEDNVIFNRLENLSIIKFGMGYYQELPANLFKDNLKLISLEFGIYYNRTFNSNVLPSSLKCLKVGESFKSRQFNSSIFPKSLELFDSSIFCDIQLPSSIKYLIIRDSDEALNAETFISIQNLEIIFIENTINGILNNYNLFNSIISNYLNGSDSQHIVVSDNLKRIFRKLTNQYLIKSK